MHRSMLLLVILSALVFYTGVALAQTDTPSPTATPENTPTITPLVLDFDPDLDRDGVISASDLILFIHAWQVRSLLVASPTPTPAFFAVHGFISSASDNTILAGASVIAGTAQATTNANGLFVLDEVGTGTDSISASKEGFQVATLPLEYVYPVTILSIALYPVGYPTHTPSPTPSLELTATLSPTETSTPATPTFTPTDTKTPTPTRTYSPTLTPTPIQLLGTWVGDLMGDHFKGTDLIWTVTSGENATAQIGSLNPVLAFYDGTYTLDSSSQITYQGVSSINGTDTITLEMTWDGFDSMMGGQFSIFVSGIGADSGSIDNFHR